MKDSVTRIVVALLLATTLALMAWPALKVTTAAAALPLTLLLGIAAAWVLHRRLPLDLIAELTALARRNRWLTILWFLLIALGMVQTARQSLHIADPERGWWLTTKQALWSEHACMVAYVYAADLHRQGEPNIYEAEHYPGMNPAAEIHTTVNNLVPEDPYVYPPQFLMLPRLAIALTDDFQVIRAVWYSLQALLMVGVSLLVARWFGGATGTLALVLTPLLWFSVPSIYNLQYGQVHITSFLLAMAAFVAFERRRDLPGGALLALAILCKGYGAFVLVPLLLWRRWRALVWTGVWGTGLTLLAVAVMGTDLFEAFFTYNLPRLKSGAAFAFEEVWPDFRTVLLAGNLSLFAFVRKLGDLGLGGMTDDLARVVHGLFTLAVVAATMLSGRVQDARSRALCWLALLNLASLTSPAAWGDYVSFGSLWLLLFLLGGFPLRQQLLLVTAGIFLALVPGAVPYGESMPVGLAMGLSLLLTLLLVGVNGWSLARGMRTVGDSS
ncbi:MAG: glycosyltransferase family 87 protein [Candidatus Krumholzibacteriota bacterium]